MTKQYIFQDQLVPSMKNKNIIFSRIWPYIKFNYSHSFLQRLYDWGITAITAKLIACQVGIVPRIYKIMRQWSSHIMMYLESRVICQDQTWIGPYVSLLQDHKGAWLVGQRELYTRTNLLTPKNRQNESFGSLMKKKIGIIWQKTRYQCFFVKPTLKNNTPIQSK